MFVVCAGMYAGLRASGNKADLSLLVADTPAVAAGVFTTNIMCAAPVQYDREVLAGSDTVKAVRLPTLSSYLWACTGMHQLFMKSTSLPPSAMCVGVYGFTRACACVCVLAHVHSCVRACVCARVRVRLCLCNAYPCMWVRKHIHAKPHAYLWAQRHVKVSSLQYEVLITFQCCTLTYNLPTQL
jgi:hypothetical protein